MEDLVRSEWSDDSQSEEDDTTLTDSDDTTEEMDDTTQAADDTAAVASDDTTSDDTEDSMLDDTYEDSNEDSSYDDDTVDDGPRLIFGGPGHRTHREPSTDGSQSASTNEREADDWAARERRPSRRHHAA